MTKQLEEALAAALEAAAAAEARCTMSEESAAALETTRVEHSEELARMSKQSEAAAAAAEEERCSMSKHSEAAAAKTRVDHAAELAHMSTLSEVAAAAAAEEGRRAMSRQSEAAAALAAADEERSAMSKRSDEAAEQTRVEHATELARIEAAVAAAAEEDRCTMSKQSEAAAAVGPDICCLPCHRHALVALICCGTGVIQSISIDFESTIDPKLDVLKGEGKCLYDGRGVGRPPRT